MRLPVLSATLLGALLALGLSPENSAAQFIPLPLFEEVMVTSPRAMRFGDAAWGDYDGDGDFDLLMAGSLQRFDRATPLTQLYINYGNTTLLIGDPTDGSAMEVPAVQYDDALNQTDPTLEDVWQSAIAWGDYDNDGDLDPLVMGVTMAGAHTLRLYENTGGFTTPLLVRFTFPGTREGDLAMGDYDNDGDLDLFVCGTDEDDHAVAQLYENDADAADRFVPRATSLDGLAFCTAEWGDYDNDGDLDLLATGVAEPQAFVTRLYRNDGHGNFSALDAGLKGLLYASAAWGDYDNDGDLDILLSGARVTPFILEGEIKIYRNDGGAFTDVSDGLAGGFENDETSGRYQGAVAWGDYDNDGYLDFFVTGARDPLSSEALQVYHNERNGRFAKPIAAEIHFGRFDGGLFGSAFWGDYDDDGDLDVFVVGETPGQGATVKTLRNYWPFPPNTPPATPDGLEATPLGNTVSLAWSPADDDHTPTPGLTYNLRVGASPGGLDLVSPMAEPDTGRRLLPQRGNAGHTTHWMVKNLPPGTYYWSVQALDSSFKGSPFAEEETFTIDG